jgi:hypothetical protein
MSAPDKPDPARGWLLVEKLLAEEESARLADASDEEVERRMRELDDGTSAAVPGDGPHRMEPSHVPSAEQLLARAAERAATRETARGAGPEAPPEPPRPPRGATVKPLRVRRRTKQRVALLAAAVLGVVVAAVVMNRTESRVASLRPTLDGGPADAAAQRTDGGR